MIRVLTKDEIESAEFRHLLWLAVEVADIELDNIARDELPKLKILGVMEDERVVAFVAFDVDTDPLTIEYIAVEESARTRGYGTALVDAARSHAVGRAIYAQTDDDAVNFYRRIGFKVVDREPDSRWPERQRYDCVLA
jgi:ribosomal protein S18 acetylase RimI-like enzyme